MTAHLGSGSRGLVLVPAAAVQDDLSLVDVVIVGVLGVAGDGMGKW